ncbi:hypothetical protein OUM_0215 [Helicobacter pylori R038b]|uniref:Uncharacterized protein n=1 Tax=Helicobacter pylori R038b TaxID=1145115 RepID=K2KBF2_HELPX|nr:hypothetical protein OUM_0215 [Helicobacter pylori R038b]
MTILSLLKTCCFKFCFSFIIKLIRDRGCFEIIPPTTLRSLYKKLSPTSFLLRLF